VPCYGDVFRDFLYARDVARWCYQDSGQVMGLPLVPLNGATNHNEVA
jgi:hypothetical protein